MPSDDPLQVVSDLVEASLVTVSESTDDEPRVDMLETVRAYAVEQLRVHGELDPAQEAHARHYLRLAEQLGPLVGDNQHVQARARLQTEHDNLRDALEWAFDPAASGTDPEERVVARAAPVRGARPVVARERVLRRASSVAGARGWRGPATGTDPS